MTRSLMANRVLSGSVSFKKKFTSLVLTLAKLTGLTFSSLGVKVGGKMSIADFCAENSNRCLFSLFKGEVLKN